MIRLPPRSTRTDTLFPYTTLVRSIDGLYDKNPALPGANHIARIERIDAAIEAMADTGSASGMGSGGMRSEEHTSELQSLMRISYAVFCLKKKNTKNTTNIKHTPQRTKNA